ncbi:MULTISPECIES: hypothetical protein [unclassified Mesorhizobium]|uniref:hypothetical protein n=1 Tax=unclassified Mesorhizobium TaxID=325217 RepID=UPI000FCAD850|nr:MULTISPECIES: hypothetical protein [unclassified Mesorhizobium]TGP22300.1 hypothetical protein EN874_019500 [Mesorhizobium sp. M1D.F.Ca.ET.231.01.1.1]TGP24730.1 hypothetical protein EN877_30695 [Mesorhizobium sp. M1D.F.Ca.ET.234.01.1.1]TGS37333.1 hypothetical protein EN827_31000 [Mesorhizobium sp. M1D.F.Ca.ET.184.01.1.1]TGS58133.1 hypothetical protein EN826_030975 [Mesorhizobium sp. M1D.F.Ca.ET.183.01.1.1]
MGRPIVDLTGERFGSLIAVEVQARSGRRPSWKCRCDCGEFTFATNGELRSGRKPSCGACAAIRVKAAQESHGFGVKGEACVNHKHGHAARGCHTKEYRAWASMIARCELPSQRSYPEYGGRGIRVCDRWHASFEAFLDDVGPAPSSGHTMDRRDNDKGYEPGNVRWATASAQANNKRGSVKISYDGETKTVAEWAQAIGVKYATLWARIFVHEWPLDRALALP